MFVYDIFLSFENINIEIAYLLLTLIRSKKEFKIYTLWYRNCKCVLNF